MVHVRVYAHARASVCVCVYACTYLGMLARTQFGQKETVDRKLAGIHSDSFMLLNRVLGLPYSLWSMAHTESNGRGKDSLL